MLIIKTGEIMERWRNYFQELFKARKKMKTSSTQKKQIEESIYHIEKRKEIVV